jgi:large conductance mechanosensitive channel
LLLATFYAFQAVVAGLIAPLISVFIGDSNFGLNSFTIGTSEFRYGIVIEAVIALGLTAGTAYFLLARLVGGDRLGRGSTKSCPECLSVVPSAARRCAYCASPLMTNRPE